MVVRIAAIYFLSLVILGKCGYPPTGDEVLPGSVLLPATRRGRYLANIVRRQAVDGTGIKFNKDADRMNADAKKKVDVLSDELLPYIIAEQERRTTLYKRIMTAIQNGEKGVTVAEIRNKPPLLIRKGLMYRCPSNRAPKEPDGTGTLMCEDDIEPTQVMYDSCLSAEDKDLYVAENKYFFCNRHKVEGPDLPRNGSTVIGCAPIERTSLNYTSGKCALEDTDDVVVHYRYYPDRTYKYVTELDPDHEVCDHWNPCQIGYIYSLPSPDQAVPANELWRGYVDKKEEYEHDEIVPPIPEDSIEEYVQSGTSYYNASPRRLRIPPGYKFDKIWAKRNRDGYSWNPMQNRWKASAKIVNDSNTVTITMTFPETWSDFFYSTYFAVFSKIGRRSGKTKTEKFLIILPSSCGVIPQVLQITHGQRVNSTLVPYHCPRCRILGVMVRTPDGHVHNLESTKSRIKETYDQKGKPKTYLEIDVRDLKPQEYGDFFAVIQNADGIEERVKVLTVEEIQLTRLSVSLEPGEHFDRTLKFSCQECELVDVTTDGRSPMAAGKVAVVPISKTITFNFPRYEDTDSGVYIGLFKRKGKTLQKIIAVIDNKSPSVKTDPPIALAVPHIGDQFEQEIKFSCDDCTVENVTANGVALELSQARRSISSGVGSVGYYLVPTTTNLLIRITEFSATFEGVYQVTFNVGNSGETVTKTVMEIGDPDEAGSKSDGEKDTTAHTSDVTEETTAAAAGEANATTPGAVTASEAATEAKESEATTEPQAAVK